MWRGRKVVENVLILRYKDKFNIVSGYPENDNLYSVILDEVNKIDTINKDRIIQLGMGSKAVFLLPIVVKDSDSAEEKGDLGLLAIVASDKSTQVLHLFPIKEISPIITSKMTAEDVFNKVEEICKNLVNDVRTKLARKEEMMW